MKPSSSSSTQYYSLLHTLLPAALVVSFIVHNWCYIAVFCELACVFYWCLSSGRPVLLFLLYPVPWGQGFFKNICPIYLCVPRTWHKGRLLLSAYWMNHELMNEWRRQTIAGKTLKQPQGKKNKKQKKTRAKKNPVLFVVFSKKDLTWLKSHIFVFDWHLVDMIV